MDIRTLQGNLKKAGFDPGAIDNKLGKNTYGAISSWLAKENIEHDEWDNERLWVAGEQLVLKKLGFDPGKIDGLLGTNTNVAREAYVKAARDEDITLPVAPKPKPGTVANIWPKQSQVPTFYGEMGANQVLVPVPYKIYYEGQLVKRISLHAKVAESATRVFAKVQEVYGSRIPELGLNLWGGSLNVRKMRGGSNWSMHSWGIAIDWDQDHNALNMHKPQARFSAPEYVPFFEAWEAEGWIGLGRERDYDWMHVQAARL